MKPQTTQSNSWEIPDLMTSKQIQTVCQAQDSAAQTEINSTHHKETQTSHLVTNSSTQVSGNLTLKVLIAQCPWLYAATKFIPPSLRAESVLAKCLLNLKNRLSKIT